MSITSHVISAETLAKSGITAAMNATTITMNARILGAIKHKAKDDPTLAEVTREQHVTITATIDKGRYLATLLVQPTELTAIEKQLIALREETYNLGFTSARIKHGFNQYALDAAIESVQHAKHDLKDDEQT